jgi:hypothetical protein
MRKRDQEHYEVARKFGAGRPFTRSEFNRLYHQEFPNRVSGPIPSDYCVNLSPKVAEACPKFLRWLGRGRYEFIGRLAEPGTARGETMGSTRPFSSHGVTRTTAAGSGALPHSARIHNG